MANNAYYFSHDSNAKDDPKCMLLIDQLGLEGYGIYWVLIEVLRDQPEFKYPLNLIPILARRYNTTAEKMMTVIRNYELFNFDAENMFFSLSLNNRMNKIKTSIEQRRIAGLASAEKRKLQLLGTTVERPLNECSTKKRKEKKGNEKKEKENIKENIKENYADFVSLTKEEFEKLSQEFGEAGANRMIEILNNYKGSSGKKYKSDYLAIRNWVISRYNDEQPKQQSEVKRRIASI